MGLRQLLGSQVDAGQGEDALWALVNRKNKKRKKVQKRKPMEPKSGKASCQA